MNPSYAASQAIDNDSLQERGKRGRGLKFLTPTPNLNLWSKEYE